MSGKGPNGKTDAIPEAKGVTSARKSSGEKVANNVMPEKIKPRAKRQPSPLLQSSRPAVKRGRPTEEARDVQLANDYDQMRKCGSRWEEIRKALGKKHRLPGEEKVQESTFIKALKRGRESRKRIRPEPNSFFFINGRCVGENYSEDTKERDLFGDKKRHSIGRPEAQCGLMINGRYVGGTLLEEEVKDLVRPIKILWSS